jgi:hypothetical protein
MSALIRSSHAVIRLRESVYLRGRHLTLHGLHGSLYCLPVEDALRLVDNGQAKLPAEGSRAELRAAVERLRQREASMA